MSTHGSVAAKVREDKERNPHRYCPRCLWRLKPGERCGKHGLAAPAEVLPPNPQFRGYGYDDGPL